MPIYTNRRIVAEELHAELCYAESLLFCSILTFLHDESLSSFVRGALKIRACYQSYRECGRLLKSEIWGGRDWRIKAQFESGTHLGVGTFNLLLSTLPTKILRLLEVVGFSGDKVSVTISIEASKDLRRMPCNNTKQDAFDCNEYTLSCIAVYVGLFVVSNDYQHSDGGK
uniref:Uncharacterized protein n=1 Tax=Parascaris equorum TaxID=6256 RepID=A0A914RUZ1_PAREQ